MIMPLYTVYWRFSCEMFVALKLLIDFLRRFYSMIWKIDLILMPYRDGWFFNKKSRGIS